jgi:cobalt-precorrin-5B (C1)-methyltransferase
MSTPPRTGYTLPVFACAAAVAALDWLYHSIPKQAVTLNLINPAEWVEIPIETVCGLKPGMALAITRSDPGDNLDLTRDTPLWAMVEWAPATQIQAVAVIGGEGIGRQQNQQDAAAIYTYAKQLLETNLQQHLHEGDRIQVTLMLPEGRALAQRTSNAAFGVVEGLSLLGTSGLSQPLSAPQQLELFQADLRERVQQTTHLVFCIGENGLDLCRQLGIPEHCLIKTANWLGPMLAAAGLQAVQSVLLFGYHGKLMKLAAGIFHTHHHVADARQEILTAHAAVAGLPTPELQQLLQGASAEAGLLLLRQLEQQAGQPWVQRIYASIATALDQRAQDYIFTHSSRQVQVGSALFDRDRRIFVVSENGQQLLDLHGASSSTLYSATNFAANP